MKPIWEHPYVNKTKGCWFWTGPLNHKGYGQTNRSKYGGQQYVHRIAYMQAVGPIAADMQICHKCDVPNCLNPKHLFLGDNFINQRDSVMKGRHYKVRNTHCPQGHPYSGKNLYVCPRGIRNCRTCATKHRKRYRAEGRY